MLYLLLLLLINTILYLLKSLLMNYLKITIGIFLVLAASRFVPHPPNFTSLIALSFYVPAILGLRYLPVVIISFAITDIYFGFHNINAFLKN